MQFPRTLIRQSNRELSMDSRTLKRRNTRWSGTVERSVKRWIWSTAVTRVKCRRDGGGDIQT